MRNKSIEFLQRYEPGFQPRMIFDVGANIGQSALEFAGAFPAARVHAFEPAGESYQALVSATQAIGTITCHHFALSDSERVGFITRNGTSPSNRLIPDAKPNAETIMIVRGDAFCTRHGIEAVDFLKIDAEGADLSVLAGFSLMLAERKFRFIQVETGLSPENRRHSPLEHVSGFLFPFGYRIFAFFSLARHLGRGIKREGATFCDTVYVREELFDSIARP